MKFSETTISGAYLLKREPHSDDRGYFARTYCAQEFLDHGVSFQPVQANISFNQQAKTLRGMHFHNPPHQEEKLVYCSSGSIFDVIVDLRSGSDTYGKWYGAELTRENGHGLFIPKGCAHGFLTLQEETEVSYLMSPSYTPGYDAGIRWDDPAIGIEWPEAPTVISKKDQNLPMLRDL
ncbi:MAG: dTDP-4-dehydrorhamnose 3,5-epimerase [Sneathiella sp.]|nr:dTDP-4-dehydrorhamnose 3,5-epimerase [Sneathiella sp.]